MDLGLAGRVYVLTGASAGLGLATARCLVADGARVVICARDRARVESAAAGLGGAERAVAVAADLAEPDAAERLVGTALDAFGRLDGALLSVGGPPTGTALSASDERWRASFETVFLGAVRAARTVAARLDTGGAIGFVLSTSVRVPITGLGLSNGLRPGLAGVAKDMAAELGPRGIRVVSLLPGRVLTDRSADLLAGEDDPEQARARIEAAIPLRRIAEPDEFGRVAAFLLSPAASYVTGVTVTIDGGATPAL